MSFGDHLEELRSRVFRALALPVPLALGLFFVAPYMRAILIEPLFIALRANGQPCQIQALSPGETITTDLKLSFIGALAISAPWLLYQFWKFIEPGLYVAERRYARFLTPLSALLAFGGILLFHWILLPFALMFLVGFGTQPARKFDLPAPLTAPTDGSTPAAPFVFPVLDEDPPSPQPGQVWVSPKNQVLRIAVPVPKFASNAIVEFAGTVTEAVSSGSLEPKAPQLSILELPLTVMGGISQTYRLSEYIDFALFLLAASVLAFQMPALILLLGWIGFISPVLLRKYRRWAYFGLVIVAALVAPPDITSLFLMLAPLLLLYELGILLLVLVPAHKVSDGRVFSVRGFGPSVAQPAQTEQSRARSSQEPQDDWHTPRSNDDDRGAGGGSS